MAARVGLRASLAADDSGAEATERAGGVMAWKRCGAGRRACLAVAGGDGLPRFRAMGRREQGLRGV